VLNFCKILKTSQRKKTAIFFVLSFLTAFSKNSYANFSLIRDAETEKFLRELSNPIFKAANLDVKNIKIYIVNDDSINAFVSGGQNVFINTGLIRKYNTPDALIGVIAHETGHIAAGHIARSSEAMDNAGNFMLLSYLLGIGAAVAGSVDAGQALILGGNNTAERLYMKFTRGQEEAADKHAIEYLDKISYPADGLINLLEFFETQMIGYKDQIDEYLMSHPVSKKRIDLIKANTKDKKFSDKKINQKLQPHMDLILAKLEGFMESPDSTLIKYKNKNDFLSNYKKSIALFRKGHLEDGLILLNKLIEEKLEKKANSTEIGFLYEIKGQFLFELGKVFDSVVAYKKSIELLKNEDSAQAKISFASSVLSLSQNDSDLIKIAIKNLQDAKKYEEENYFLYKQLANAYNKINDEGRSLLALAEYNFYRGEKDKSVKYAQEAKDKLPKDAKEEITRAEDLIALNKKKDDKKESKKNNFTLF